MKTVLVVDFVEENLTIVRDVLMPDYRVLLADSVDEAIRLRHEYKPDIVMINYVIPNTNGVDILKKLSHEKNDFLAILMTNIKEMDFVVDAVLQGFDGFIKIPVDNEKFHEKVKKAKLIHQMRVDAGNYLKTKATKAMSITFAHYTRNLLTPLLGYLPKIKNDIDESIYEAFDESFNKINKLSFLAFIDCENTFPIRSLISRIIVLLNVESSSTSSKNSLDIPSLNLLNL